MRDCGQCGRRAAPGESFCSSCGSYLEWHGAASSGQEADADTLPLDGPGTLTGSAWPAGTRVDGGSPSGPAAPAGDQPVRTAAAPPRVGLEVTPHQQVTDRAARFAVRVSNAGREAVDVGLSAEDPRGALRLRVEPQRLHVPAGGHAEAAVQAAVPGRPPGRPVPHECTVQVVAACDPHRGALLAATDVVLVHAASAHGAGHAPSDVQAHPSGPPPRRRWPWVLLAAVVVLVLAVVGAVQLVDRAGGVDAVVVGGVNVRTAPSGSAPLASDPLADGTRVQVECLTPSFARIDSPVEGFVFLPAIRLQGEAPAC